MTRRRPDQDKFDQFIAPLEEFDEAWERAEREFGFVLEKNPYRKPGRILRKKTVSATTTVTWMIEVYLEPFWQASDFSVDLPYTFAVGTHVEKHAEEGAFWALSSELANGQSIELMGQRFPELFERAKDLLAKFTPEYVVEFGERKNRLH